MSKIVGIVASKLGHSLSPDIHNYWSKKTKSKLIYKKFEIKEKELEKFIGKFRKNKNLKGFNVTIPYKEIFFKLSDRLSARAKNIGSVNLIYKKNNLIYGDNTDVIGFSKCYSSLRMEKPKSVLLIGAGGAARSILYFLNKKNIENIDVFAQSFKRLKGVRADFIFKNFAKNTAKLKQRYDLIINASSAGMVGSKKLNKNILAIVQKSKGVIDIVYNPTHTDLLKLAAKHNINCVGGLKMLIEQAKPSFEIWANKKVKVDSHIYYKLKKKIK